MTANQFTLISIFLSSPTLSLEMRRLTLIALAAPCDLSTLPSFSSFPISSGASFSNFILISFSLLPNCGASTVIKSPLIPRDSACSTNLRVMERSLFT